MPRVCLNRHRRSIAALSQSLGLVVPIGWLVLGASNLPSRRAEPTISPVAPRIEVYANSAVNSSSLEESTLYPIDPPSPVMLFSAGIAILGVGASLGWFAASYRQSRAIANPRLKQSGEQGDRPLAPEPPEPDQTLNRVILNALPDLLIWMHRDGTYLDIKRTNVFPIEFPNLRVGENIRNILPPEAAQKRLEVAANALESGETQIYEFPLVVEGQSLWQEARVMPLDTDEVLVVIRDLTERKHMEAALRHSEARLAMAHQVAQVGYWELDLHDPLCQHCTWSETMFEHWGMAPDHAQPKFSELLQQVHPDDRTLFQTAVENAIARGEPYTLDLRVIHSDGSIRYLDSRAEPLFDAAGTVIKLIGTSLDITKRKQTEQALQEREAMLRAIGDNLPKGFIYQRTYEPGKGFYYSYVSAGIERLLGLKPEDVLADSSITRSVGFPEDLARADQVAQESLKNLTGVELQMRNRTAQGQIQWSSIRSTPRRLEDGRTVWDGVEVDITELKRIEAALRASEEQFRKAFDHAPIGISLVMPTGHFVKVNTYYCDLLGYTEAELLRLRFQDITHPGDLDVDEDGFQKILSGEIRTFQMEKRYVSKQGTIIPVLMNTALIRDQEGEPLYLVGHIQDIRDRQQVERMKDEFISVVSHELRTPLTSIRGALGLISSGVFDNRPEKMHHMIQIAMTNSDRLVRLVDDILSLERLQSGKVALVMEQCQVADLMDQAIDSVQAIADQAGIHLIVDSLTALFWASPDAIVQTLTNLLSNAIKFSSPGQSIWLKAERCTEARIPPPQPFGSPLFLLFTVKDEGRGIPTDKLEIIFEQFQQVDVSDSRKKGGTGLGLAICKNIVQQHGGQIWVESCIDQGSTFFVALPLLTTRKDGHFT